jgi:hypothetical protein
MGARAGSGRGAQLRPLRRPAHGRLQLPRQPPGATRAGARRHGPLVRAPAAPALAPALPAGPFPAAQPCDAPPTPRPRPRPPPKSLPPLTVLEHRQAAHAAADQHAAARLVQLVKGLVLALGEARLGQGLRARKGGAGSKGRPRAGGAHRVGPCTPPPQSRGAAPQPAARGAPGAALKGRRGRGAPASWQRGSAPPLRPIAG